MKYSISASKDAFLLENDDTRNTGLDAILEVSKSIADSSTYNTRMLVKFDLTHLSSSIVDNSISDYKIFLKLYEAEAMQIPTEFNVYLYPVSQSWNMGTGTSTDSPRTRDGVSWKYRDSYTDGTLWETSSWAPNTTGSATGGGVWYEQYNATHSYYYNSSDINVDVTDIVDLWLDSTIPNEGFIIKKNETDENSSSSFGEIDYFSVDTNTIYYPKLELQWDDSAWNTGSLTATNLNNDYYVYIENLKKRYYKKSKVRFRIHSSEKYITKTYTTSFQAYTGSFLPSSSYYGIKDAHTNEYVIGIDDDYTKISCDSTGNYFDMWMEQFEPERYYRLVFKLVTGSKIEYHENNSLFKVIE